MPYVETNFYKESYGGTVIPDNVLDTWLQKASDSIDLVTNFKIPAAGGLTKLTSHQQTMVKLAVCCQAEHLYNKDSLGGFDISSYSVNGTSVSLKTPSQYSKDATEYLKAANLLYRGL